MALPAGTKRAARLVAVTLHHVSQVAHTLTLDAIDKAALDAASSALDALIDWTKDTTEAGRCRVAGRAGIVTGLTLACVLGWRNPTRYALALIALAFAAICEGNEVRAANACRAARQHLASVGREHVQA